MVAAKSLTAKCLCTDIPDLNNVPFLPCDDTLPVVVGLAPYRDSESCAGKVQPSRRGRGRVGRRKSAQDPPVLGVLRRTNDPTM